MMRMSRVHFSSLLTHIESHEVFHHITRKQFPPIVQLAVTLFRFGVYGNAASIQNVSKEFGISDGGSITCMTERVIRGSNSGFKG